jgi:hypothetical protein
VTTNEGHLFRTYECGCKVLVKEQGSTLCVGHVHENASHTKHAAIVVTFGCGTKIQVSPGQPLPLRCYSHDAPI